MIKPIQNSFVYIIFLFFWGCHSIQQVPIPDLKIKVTDLKKGRIYLASSGDGDIGKHKIPLIYERLPGNKKNDIGFLQQGDFFVWERQPGKVWIGVSRDELYYPSSPHNKYKPTEFLLNVEAGKEYYLDFKIIRGLFMLTELSFQDGSNLIKKLNEPTN